MDSNKLLISIVRILNETNLFNKSFSIQQSIALGGSLAHGIAWLGVRPPSKQQIGNPIARRPPLSNKGVKSFLKYRLLTFLTTDISYLQRIHGLYFECFKYIKYCKYIGHLNQIYSVFHSHSITHTVLYCIHLLFKISNVLFKYCFC